MRLLIRANLAVMMLASAAPPAMAQGTDARAREIAAGTRVRVTQAGAGRRAGTVAGLAADTLIVRWDDARESAVVPLGDVAGLEISRGKHRRILRGTAIGLMLGGGAGLLLGTTTSDEDQGYAVPGLGLLGGAAGGLVGLMVGARTRERWEAVPLGAGRVRVGFVSASGVRHGMRIGGALSF